MKSRVNSIPYHPDTLASRVRHVRGTHAWKRLGERLPGTREEKLREVARALYGVRLPKGSHHVPLDGGAVVLKDTGRGHVVATVLGPGMSRPGQNVSLYLKTAAFSDEIARLASA